ncbi:holin-associated N-acetylmuramidase [Paracoccus sp. SCSIO 75233]|uniref:holin-associated N-acetylmuramidase n=1 Tax=Paracoccus sp. SCSIO 75233 TaxID=3017782 RepID=UPI0022F11B6B|nr:holin-associated N-acetylmuramidase [Paracoccus sp. SCSIO 75233]WBU52011.1 holin-associated N-acetylmuramidase [Paracoccus sp. SCSIO 75233]
MKTIDQIAAEIVAREGGYVNDPDDPGGATKYGITIGTMRRLGLDLTNDGKIGAADVKRLTRAQAVEIMKLHYYRKPRIAELPAVLQAPMFDMYVNAGANAVRVLQRMLDKMGFTVQADGMIGPKTIAAAHAAAAVAPDHLADAYGIERRNYYYALADRRVDSRKYARTRRGGKGGWITRAEAFMAPRYHLSDAAHRERTAAWA